MSRHPRAELNLPEYMRSVPRTKPRPDEPGQLFSFTERMYEYNMRLGSDRLLSAIWHNHQRVMLVARAMGRNVVIPDRAA